MIHTPPLYTAQQVGGMAVDVGLPQLEVFLELLLLPVWKTNKLRVRHLENLLELVGRQVLLQPSQA